MDLNSLREQIYRLRKSGDTRLVGAAIIAAAILAAPLVPRLLPQAPEPTATPTVAPAPPGTLAKVAEALRANGEKGANESTAFSRLIDMARSVGRVANRAEFIEAIQKGFATQLGAGPVELAQDAIKALAGWLWDSVGGDSGGPTTGDAIVLRFDRLIERETIVRDSVVERHYMPAELRLAFTVLFTKSSGWEGPEVDAQMQAFGKDWRREIDNRDCTALVRGAADTVGRDKDNYELSKRRAAKVSELLTKEFGLPKDRISIETTGERGLASPTLDSVDALVNRRVDVRIRCEP